MADFAALKERVTLVQAAQSVGLNLRTNGEQLRGPCTACKAGGDRALVLTPSKGLFYCFSAGIGGDLISLVGHIKKCSLADAGRHIADQFGDGNKRTSASVHQSTTSQKPTAPPAPAKFDAEAYAARLETSHEALAGLGLAPAILKEFKAGYATTGLNRGRLALPLYDTQGNILGFCGRALGEEEPQLIFPKNFDPQSVAFNWQNVRDADMVYLCHDPLDVMKAHQSGMNNAIAALGALTPTFLQVLSLWMEENNVLSIEPV